MMQHIQPCLYAVGSVTVFSYTALQTGHWLGLSHRRVVRHQNTSPRVHVEHSRIVLTHREQPNRRSELQKCIYSQMRLKQFSPRLSPLFVLSMDFWLDSSGFMLDFQLLNRRTNGNGDLASSSSASTLHPQRSYRSPGICFWLPWVSMISCRCTQQWGFTSLLNSLHRQNASLLSKTHQPNKKLISMH